MPPEIMATAGGLICNPGIHSVHVVLLLSCSCNYPVWWQWPDLLARCGSRRK